jgi:WD40 repeat protein
VLVQEICIHLWDLVSGKEKRRIKGHAQNITAVAIAPDGVHLASGCVDGAIRVWRLTAKDPPLLLKEHTEQVVGLAYVAKGEMLLSAGRDGMLRLWDPKTGQVKSSMKARVGRVSAVAYTPILQRIAIGGEALQIRERDGHLLTLEGHRGPVTKVAFSDNGRLLASGSADGTVRLWNTHTGQEHHVCRGHAGKVNGVAFTPDASTVYSAGADGSIRRWKVPELT